ncbi:MAG: T9SS type A sorting domain-containing protein, partial [Flavobacteriales bacterium]|nr:T9SS type A sorting domain-containing protein [Flavobacteriales bacterium]
AISDVYTTAADANNTALDASYGNGGDEGLYPFVGPGDGNGPWEWIDTAVVQAEAPLFGPDASVCIANMLAGNPVYQAIGQTAGRLRALTFIDTIQGYLTPRLYRVLVEAPSAIEDINENSVTIYPNPAEGVINFRSTSTNPINGIDFYTTTGQLVKQVANVASGTYTVSDLNLPTGMYIVNVHFDNGTATKKVVIK